jgi:hypothetical protein
LHAWPSAHSTGLFTHSPVSEAHMPTVQRSGASHTTGAFPQPESGSQVSVVQRLRSSQSTGSAGAQPPLGSHSAVVQALPSSAACESGYLGSVEEALEFVQYNLEIGNHWPFSYFIGNPFAIGYWQSEGIAIPREEAYQQLTENYLPSPEEAVVFTDPADFPDLLGMKLENMWGPDVEVAANLYSKGWGPDGQDEAIIVIARCHQDGHDAYFWYGMLYGRFE